MTGTRAGVAMLLLVAWPTLCGAAEPDRETRLRALEEQLQAAQRRIKKLERALGGRSGVKEEAGTAPTASEPAPAGQPPETAPPAARAEEPVELLLEALHKQGSIADDDYQALKEAIAAKRRAGEERRAERSRLTRDLKRAQDLAQSDAKKGRLPVRVSYRLGKGLDFRTDDGRFDGVVSNRVQGRYTFTDVQDDPLQDDRSSFRIRRMNTVIQGHVLTQDLFYRLEVSFAPRVALDDAFLIWQPRTYFGIQAGQFRVPFSRQELTSSGALQLVDRSEPGDFFSPGRDIGLTLTGNALGPKQDRLEWELGIFNGNGVGRPGNETSDHLAAARLLLMPFGAFDYYVEGDAGDTRSPRLGFGGGGLFNSQADSSGRAGEKAPFLEDNRIVRFFGAGLRDRFDVAEATADVQFKYRGFSMLGDYYWAEADPNLLPSKSARGYNLQTGYFVLPRRLEAAFRYASASRDLDSRRSGLREIGGALNYFLLGDGVGSDAPGNKSGYLFVGQGLKLQLDVSDVFDEDPLGQDRDTMEYRLQLQAVF